MSTKEDDDSNDSSGQGLKALGESDEKKVWCTEEDWLNYKNKKHFIRGDNSAWAKTLPCRAAVLGNWTVARKPFLDEKLG